MIYEENDETRVDARDEVSADYLVTVHVADMKRFSRSLSKPEKKFLQISIHQ